jgi:hypothetical protein
MTPSPAEIAAVLAAPPAVQEALRRVEGPGWRLYHSGAPVLAEAPAVRADVRWLPVDPTAIVAEAGRLHALRWDKQYTAMQGVELEDGRWWARIGMGAPEGEWGDSPRLAAIALLSAVVGVR